MTGLSREQRARRLLLNTLAMRATLHLGATRFTTLSRLAAPVLTADQVAIQLSAWEDTGLITGSSSLIDGIPEPIYHITKTGQAECDRLRDEP